MRDNHKTKAVIFDLGNVLIDFDHRIAAGKIADFTGRTGEDIYNLFFDSELTGLFEEGRIPAREFFSQIQKMLGLKIGYDKFVPIWNEIFFLSQKNRAVYSLAKALKGRYKLAVLSNVNILHLRYLKKEFPVFDIFNEVIASCELKLKKPDPLIYKKALSVLGVPAQSAFYTDDRPELIASAGALGLRSFVFSGVEQLKKDLLSQGISI